MKSKTTILQYKGRITFDDIGLLIKKLDKNKDKFNIDLILYKKLLALMIEILENVLKYSDQFSDFISQYPEYQPEFNLVKNKGSFYISTKNPIRTEDIREVKTRIDRVNKLDEAGLKKYYHETITNGIFTEKGGAGLGFLEMAKITKRPLKYNLSNLTVDYSNLEIKLEIPDPD